MTTTEKTRAPKRLAVEKLATISVLHGSHTVSRKAPLVTRFWSRVEKTPGCWLWRGHVNAAGYGCISAGKRLGIGAHRVAWELVRGPIPPKQWVLHRCDNPPCVNPDHLFLGDATDNNRDRHAKGRTYMPGLKLGAVVTAARKACVKGHSYEDVQNTGRRQTGQRWCRTCHRERERLARARRSCA